MFEKLRQAVSIGLVGACLSSAGCERSVEPPPVPSGEAIKLGNFEETTFYLKTVGNRTFLVTDAIDNNCLIEHPARVEGAHQFSVKKVDGQCGDGSMYLINLDGIEYMYLDGLSGGDITKLSQGES